MLLSIITICALPTASVQAADIAVGMIATDVSFGEALLIAGISSFLGFDTHVVTYHHSRSKLPLPSILTALLFSRMFDVDHHRIVAWRSRGHGWGRIANDLGVHPGTFNKFRRGLDIGRISNNDFERLIFEWYLSEYYGVGRDRIYNWQRSGHAPLSILIALDVGAKSRRQVSDLFSARKSLASWNAVADRVGVGKAARRYPQQPKGGQEYRAKGRGGGGGGPAAGPGRRGDGPGKSNPGQSQGNRGRGRGPNN